MRFTILPAVGLGAVALMIAIVPGGVWTLLVVANLRMNPAIPWSVTAMGLLLWALWRYLDGHWPPRRTAETRRRLLRVTSLPSGVFAWAFIAGSLGTVALAGLWIVLLQLVRWPVRVLPDFSNYPLFTVTTVIIMACVVSSAPEEAGFRGYFQSFLERKLPAAAAIIISSLVMTPAHCLTQGFLWPIVLFYFLVDSMLGTMAYLTKSILPSMAVHFLGLLLFFTLIWPKDATRSLSSNGGSSPWLWIHVAQFIICGFLAVVAFWRLALLQPVADAA